MYGTDGKLCDPSFSHWDWIAVRRARELQMGCPSPDELDLRFADGAYAPPAEQQAWIEHDATLAPSSNA